jgi:hypothetical protein
VEETFAAVVVAVAPLFFAALASWLNRQQQEVIAYLVEEHRVLRARLRGRRLRLTDDQRRRRAARGQCLGRAALSQVATIVTPDTLLRVASAPHRTEVDLGAAPATARRAPRDSRALKHEGVIGHDPIPTGRKFGAAANPVLKLGGVP